MIGYIKGKVLIAREGSILLENNGIGYEIFCSSSLFELLSNRGEGEAYTYMNVREDGVYLYGFISPEEKSMFLKLISVSGVGPKMAITVLSSLKLKDLAYIIATQDVKSLSSVKGLGKKTAERIILELREKISSLDLPDEKKKKEEIDVQPKLSQMEEDAIIALMSLGFNRSESIKSVAKAKENGSDTVETLIAVALQYIR